MKGLETTLENTFKQLEDAVGTGDVKNAQALVSVLAKQKQQIKIHAVPQIGENGFRIKVIIEDRLSSAPPFILKIPPQITTKELKTLVFSKFSFPVEVQRLIVSQKIPKDGDVLSKHGVKDGSIVYIYMVPAHKVNLTKEKFQEELALMHGRSLPEGGPQFDPRLSMSNLDLSPLPVSGPKSGSLTSMPRHIHYSGTDMGGNPSMPSIKPVDPEKIGWKCPKCTYINLPHRPGCEMCASNRPSDYQIPDNYEMSPKEMDWRKMEDDAFQANKQILPPPPPSPATTTTTRSLSPSHLSIQEHRPESPQMP